VTDSKISALPAASNLTGVEIFPLVQNGISSRITLAAIGVGSTLNVLSYGADPTGVTDSGAAINNAINALPATGGTVFFPPGTYLSNIVPIVGRSNVSLMGAGWNSIIKSTALPNGGTNAGQRQVDYTGCSNFSISNLALDCSGITSFLAGVRSINLNAASSFIIQNCYLKTCGAATTAPGASNYLITGNTAFFSSTNGIDNANGVFDQWGGANNFTISGNTVYANNVAQYPILVTGQTTALVAAACYNFTITGNIITGANQVGIWVNGRNGVNYLFDITGNTVNGCVNFYGIAVADSYLFTVSGNSIKNTGTVGLKFYSEGGSYTNGCTDFTVVGNVVYNANQLAAGGANGVAIGVINPSTTGSIVGNRVGGSGHTYAVYLDGSVTGTEIIGGNYAAGSSGTVANNNGANRVLTPATPSTGWGTPTGNLTINNFPGASATLLQTSEAVAQIITLLKNLGVATV
jgi:Pectate lyase superfamily protein